MLNGRIDGTIVSQLSTLVKILPKDQQTILLAALSGARVPGQAQKITANILSFLVKSIFFGSYVLQTLEGNKNPIYLAWPGAIISGSLNAILGGSLDSLIIRAVKSTKSFGRLGRENWKENISGLLLLLPLALYFGYAQAGPFGEGTQVALKDLLGCDEGGAVSQVFTWATVVTEGAFLTHASFDLLANGLAQLCLEDKKISAIIAGADHPAICAFDALEGKELAAYKKPVSTARSIGLVSSFSFICFAYALTMADSTQRFLVGNPLYSWLVSNTVVDRIPLGSAALNITACINYSGYLLDGLLYLVDPFVRGGKALKGEDGFFTDKDKDHSLVKYIAKYVFVVVGAYLAYSSSVERAKAGDAEDEAPPALIVFLQTYFLSVMAINVNSWALEKLFETVYVPAKQAICYAFGSSTTDQASLPESPVIKEHSVDLSTGFSAGEYRKLKALVGWLKECDPTDPRVICFSNTLDNLEAQLAEGGLDKDTFAEFIAEIVVLREASVEKPSQAFVFNRPDLELGLLAKNGAALGYV
ncbi:MAG: hypothetical protein Q7V63_02090 [Gammaproteobacteria bacterium]|nr:hypothetical protein [Gammaproteobacteria bacterium]